MGKITYQYKVLVKYNGKEDKQFTFDNYTSAIEWCDHYGDGEGISLWEEKQENMSWGMIESTKLILRK